MLALITALAVQVGCPSALDLQASLNAAKVSSFVARITPLTPSSGEMTPHGGFRIATPTKSSGEIIWQFSPMTEFDTACGLRVVWRPSWTAGILNGNGPFTVSAAPASHPPENTFGDTVYRVSPEADGSRLTVEKAGKEVAAYHLDFRATAVSMTPPLHTAAIQLDLIGLQPDGSIVFADFLTVLPGRQ